MTAEQKAMKFWVFEIFFAFLCSSSVSAITANAVYDQSLLSNATIPISYDVSLKTRIHLGKGKLSGSVKIKIEALESTNVITIHHGQLEIDSVQVLSESSKLLQSTFKCDTNFIRISLKEQLQANSNYQLVINYHGLQREQKVIPRITAIHVQFIGARGAFPCYDEPQFRTPFTIEIKDSNFYSAISNMPVASVRSEFGVFTVTKFHTTPPIQTHTVAIVVSNLENTANEAGKSQRVFAKPWSIDNREANFAIAAGVMLLEKLEETLGVPFALSKIDQVAVVDFVGAVTGNWVRSEVIRSFD
jgi:aminopeptidase N